MTFPKKITGSRIVADLQKTYENLTTNLGKILRNFENRAPEVGLMLYHWQYNKWKYHSHGDYFPDIS